MHSGRLYVTTLNQEFRAYDAASCALLWSSASLGAPFLAKNGGNPVVIAVKTVVEGEPCSTPDAGTP